MAGMADRSVSAVVTSPPYNLGINYRTYRDVRGDSEFTTWLETVWKGVHRILKDDGHFFLQVGGTATRPLIPWQILNTALEAGFVLQNEIIWVKNISVLDESYGQFKPLNSDRFLNHCHEFIFHLTKTGKVPIDKLAVGVKLKWKSNIKRFHHKGSIRCRGNCWFIPYETIYSKAQKHHHPAIFPVALPRMCIQFSGIPQGSLVLDPFVGIGTTLVACEQLGMNGTGFDIDSKYVEISNRRVLNLKSKNITNDKG
jgi:site-specific DNA-methyltransferase (adenine-specific)